MEKGRSWLLGSRSRVFFTVLFVLLLLDLGRSIYARIGFSQPAEVWQPDSKIYSDLKWPPGNYLSPDLPLGEGIYFQKCAVCHGPDGRGNGPAAPSMIPRPRDFTKGQFKYKSTPPGQPPSHEDLVSTVSNGLRGSAMPYWHDLLSENEINEVVSFIKGFSSVFQDSIPESIEIPPRVEPNEESLKRGQILYGQQGCLGCHGLDGRATPRLKDSKGYPVFSRDLSAPWTFRGGSSPEQIWLRITTGLAPSPMPSYAEVIPPDERWDLVNYVLSLARVPPWEAGGKLEGPGQHRDLIRRGEYLVHAQMCGLCHTQINRTGIYRGDDFYLAGGMRVDAYPHGFYISRNLTSDPETGLGRWAKEEIANAIRNGRSRDRVLNPVDMPWHYLHALEEEDAMAIASYLKTLKPVYNKISHALHYGVVETIVMKLLEPTKVLRFIDGNFGQRPQGPLLGLPQEILVGAQLLVFILGIFAFLFAGPPNRRYPQTISGWIFLFFMVIGIFLLCMVGLAVFRFPGFILIPPDRVANTVLTKIPTPNETHLKSPEQAALVKRGRYLYTVASCALCHGPEGGGGLKISWQAFGTLWTRNITPHPENGIGAWNELEIARAIRSGVTPDGRMLHWQGMIWDHASNWDEEDIRALGAYLRTLPPVDNEVPPARPPAPDDCKKYTFWITPSDLYGCQ